MHKKINPLSFIAVLVALVTCLLFVNSCSKRTATSSNLLQLLEPNTLVFFRSVNAGKAYEVYKNSVWSTTENFFDSFKNLTKNDAKASKAFEEFSNAQNEFTNFLNKSNVEEILFSISKKDLSSPISFESVNACFYGKSKDASSAKLGVEELNKKLLKLSDKVKSEQVNITDNCKGNKVVINPDNDFTIYLASKGNVIISCKNKENLVDICTEKNKGTFIKALNGDKHFSKLNKKVSFKKGFSQISMSYVNANQLIKDISEVTKGGKDSIDLTKYVSLNHLVATVGITEDGSKLKNIMAMDIPSETEAGKRWNSILSTSAGHATKFSIGDNPVFSLISDAKAVGEVINAIAEDIPMKEKEKQALNQVYAVVSQVETLALSIHQEQVGALPIPGIIIRASGDKLKESYGMFINQIKSEMQKNGVQGMGQWTETKVNDVSVNKFMTPFGIGLSLAFHNGAIYFTTSDKLLETAIKGENKNTLGLTKNQIQSFSINFTKLLDLIKKVEMQASMFTGGQPLIKDKTMLDKLEKLGTTKEYMSFDDNIIGITVDYTTADKNEM